MMATREDSAKWPTPNRFLRFSLSLIAACTFVVILITFCGFAARFWWRFEQLCHFRIQYFWLLALSTLILVLGGRRRLAAAAGFVALVNLAMVLPIYLPARHAAAPATVGHPTIELVLFNVLGKNRQCNEVAAWLRSESADVVLLLEIQPHWMPMFETLRDLYPHQHVVSRRDNFGVALLSKKPWSSIETATFGSAELPSIVAAFQTNERTWTLLGTHPLPPGSAYAAAARNEQLVAIGEFAQQHSSPLIVAGDLNLTEHSPYFGDLLRSGKLRDSRQGIGIQASWAARLPGLDLPLDHVLVSREWNVFARRVGPHLGSDHRPVMARLRLQ
jgi:endonuclease/exonuclease/phosphatase (EEP) superfamily protein YafD